MLFYCETCFGVTGPKIRSVDHWLDHLQSPSHQTKAKPTLLTWSVQQNEKSWVVTNVKQDGKLDKILTLQTLIAHFFKFGFICDIYMDPERRFAVVQADFPKELRRKLPVLSPGECIIEGIPVKLIGKASVSEDAWAVYFSLPLPMAKGNATIESQNSSNSAGAINITSQTAIKKNIKETNKNRTDLPHMSQQGPPTKFTSNPQPIQINSKSTELKKVLATDNSGKGPPKPEPLIFYNKNMQDPNALEKGINRKANQAMQEPLLKRQKNKKGEPQTPSTSTTNNANFSKSRVDTRKDNKYTANNPPNSNFSSNLHRPPTEDYFYLFKELPRMNLAARSTHKQNKEFSKIDLDDQLDNFIYSITMTEEDWRKRDQLLQELTEVLKRKYPKCLLYPFGSMSTGLGDPSSDIDIYVDIFGETSGIHVNPYEVRRFTKQELMIEIKKLLRDARVQYPSKRPLYGKIIPVLSARVPILKFYHILSKINVDLSFENLLSYQNTKMIHFLMTLDERVKPLLLLVRYWGKFHDLTGSTLIKNYAFILMVLVFLARKKIIPKIVELQSLLKSSYSIDGWNAGFCEDRELVLSSFPNAPPFEKNPITGLPTTSEILSLAREFFSTCAHIDFSKNMICSLTADLLPKENFVPGNEENLPQELDLYKSWSSKQSVGHRLNITTSLVLQDPFLLSFNVGGVTSEATLLKFQVACAQTVEILNGNVRSIVDVFVPLPKQLGDKKFMSMQRIHKRHQRIQQEIKEALCCGDSKPDSNVNATPVHLLPIEQIISKKTVQFGQGWETYLHYTLNDSTNKLFSRLFLKEIKCLLDSESVQQTDVENKINSLWVSFVKEFLVSVWFPCFGITHAVEETVKPERRRADDFTGRRRRGNRGLGRKNNSAEKTNGDENPFENGNPELEEHASDDNEAEEDEVGLSQKKSNEDKDVLLEKFNAIQDQDYCLTYYKFKCTSNISFWSKRDFLRKQVIKMSEPPTAKKAGKKRAERRQNINLLSKTNPFEIEKNVMKLIDENDRKDSDNLKEKTTQFQCNCWVKIDTSCIDDFSEVFILFEKDINGFTQNYGSGGSSLSTTMKKLLPDYTLFKLMQWFGIGNENDSKENTHETGKSSEIDFLFSDSEEEINNDAQDCDDDIETPELSFQEDMEKEDLGEK